jgi:hypothetical protein
MITTRATTQNGWKKRKEKTSLTRGFFFPQFWQSEYQKKFRELRKLVEFSLEKHT